MAQCMCAPAAASSGLIHLWPPVQQCRSFRTNPHFAPAINGWPPTFYCGGTETHVYCVCVVFTLALRLGSSTYFRVCLRGPPSRALYPRASAPASVASLTRTLVRLRIKGLILRLDLVERFTPETPKYFRRILPVEDDGPHAAAYIVCSCAANLKYGNQ
jgi:hypothetical protein